MSEKHPYQDLTFPFLLKKYLLLSGFNSLHQFSEAMTEKGLHFDASLFSHWKNGQRQPNDRHTILTMLEIFHEKRAISFLEEANHFMASVGLGYLTSQERKTLFSQSPILSSDNYEFFFKKIAHLSSTNQYFLNFLSQGSRRNIYFYPEIESSHEDIVTHIEELLLYKLYKPFLQIWEYFGPFLWDTGRWMEFGDYCAKAVNIAYILNETEIFCRLLVEEQSWLLYWHNKPNEALQALEKVTPFLRESSSNVQALYYLRLAMIHKNDKLSSLKYANKARKIVDMNEDCIGLESKSYLLLGNIMAEDEVKMKIKCYEKALKTSRTPSPEDYSKALFYLGTTKREIDPLAAQAHFEDALYIDEKNKRRAGVAWNTFELGKLITGDNGKQLLFQAAHHFDVLGMHNVSDECEQFQNKK